jgi:hypothetical protein
LGVGVGLTVKVGVGELVGKSVAVLVGSDVGVSVGNAVGVLVGTELAISVGMGVFEGAKLGPSWAVGEGRGSGVSVGGSMVDVACTGIVSMGGSMVAVGCTGIVSVGGSMVVVGFTGIVLVGDKVGAELGETGGSSVGLDVSTIVEVGLDARVGVAVACTGALAT